MENIHKTICDDETQLKEMNVRKSRFLRSIHQMATNQSSLGLQFASQSHFITPVGTYSLQKLKMSLVSPHQIKDTKIMRPSCCNSPPRIDMNNYVIHIIMQT